MLSYSIYVVFNPREEPIRYTWFGIRFFQWFPHSEALLVLVLDTGGLLELSCQSHDQAKKRWIGAPLINALLVSINFLMGELALCVCVCICVSVETEHAESLAYRSVETDSRASDSIIQTVCHYWACSIGCYANRSRSAAPSGCNENPFFPFHSVVKWYFCYLGPVLRLSLVLPRSRPHSFAD